MKRTITNEQLEKIYDEASRRLGNDLFYLKGLHKNFTMSDFHDYIGEFMQGVYGTIKVLVSDDEWKDIVQILDEIENRREWNDFSTWGL